jgi:hypothetical protein
MRLLVIGGSDAGVSAGLRARELDRSVEVTLLVGNHHAEVAKRIDIPAAALFHAMTVDGLSELDLSYTPPFGSPWDAIQLAAQAWTKENAQSRTSSTGGGLMVDRRKTRLGGR